MANEPIKRKGVDISTHNGSVDFAALQRAGVEFVIIRCGYGSDYKNQDDVRFAENVKKAEAAGMPWGVYLYSYAEDLAMAKSEAQHVKRLLNGRKPLYGVWYDIEDKALPNDKKTLSDIVVTFCEAIEAEGLFVGVYTWGSWFDNRLDSRVNSYDKWVCQWNNVLTYEGSVGIWQYTDKLKIGGKTFDGNWAYKDYPAIIGGTAPAKKPAAVKVDREKSFDPAKAGVYKCTANLNLRTGASTSKKRVELMGKGTKVYCTGHYTRNGKTDWLMVVTEKDKLGFCSTKYLQKA